MGEIPAFDTYQRFHVLAQAVRALLPPPRPASVERNPRVLDVGGYPGWLAESLAATHDVVTVDRESGPLNLYVRASGDGLPFASDSFDAAIASDVLEHVPADRRDAFLGEMARVARGWILLGGPFRSRAVDAAEESLAEAARATGQENKWIEEHRRCGLPDLTTTRHALEKLGYACAISPNGALFSWFTLQHLKIVLHAMPDGFAAFDAINDLYVRLCCEVDHTPPTYRHLVIAHKDESQVERFANAISETLGIRFVRVEKDALVDPPDAEERIRQASQAFRGMAVSFHGAGGDATARIEADYVSRLESLLRAQEERQSVLESEIRRLKDDGASRFGRFWKWFGGR